MTTQIEFTIQVTATVNEINTIDRETYKHLETMLPGLLDGITIEDWAAARAIDSFVERVNSSDIVEINNIVLKLSNQSFLEENELD